MKSVPQNNSAIGIPPSTTKRGRPEEQSRSWIARLGRERDVAKQVAIYERLNRMFDFFADWTVIDFTDAAAERFTSHRSVQDVKDITAGPSTFSSRHRDFHTCRRSGVFFCRLPQLSPCYAEL